MRPEPRAPHRPEPGARHDQRGRFGFGAGVTPFEDLTSSVFFIGLLIWLSMTMLRAVPDVAADTVVWFVSVMVFCQLALVAGAIYTAMRGIRRWRWRLANVRQTGGVYLRPWEKTPRATR